MHVSLRRIECVLKASCLCPHGCMLVSSRLHACVLTFACICPQGKMLVSSRMADVRTQAITACVLKHYLRISAAEAQHLKRLSSRHYVLVSSCFFASISVQSACVLKPFCFYQRAHEAYIGSIYAASSILKAFCLYHQHRFCVRRDVMRLI